MIQQIRKHLSILLLLAIILSIGIPTVLAEEVPSPYEVFVYDLPKGIKKACEQAGTVHEEHYSTAQYSVEGEKLADVEGTLYVYTPYGYDPAKQYDVLYLMHGAGETVGFWLGQGEYALGGPKYNKAQCTVPQNIVDNRISAGECKEMILVAMTFLNQFGEDDDLYAAGSTMKLRSFGYEFKNDIVPYVESHYSTFANGNVTPDDLIASRDHRAYAGFSMGSMTGWQAIWMDCVDYVAYIGNFSGCDAQGDGVAQRVAETLNTKFAQYPIRYWYNGNGTEDSLHDDHVAGFETMLELCADRFQVGEDFANGDNTIFVDKPGKKHNYANWNVDLYNITSVFFQEF